MIDIKQEVNELYQKCILKIKRDFQIGKKLSFHHYATKHGLDADRLKSEWENYHNAKKGKV